MSSKDSVENLTPRNIYCIGRNYAAHAQELGNPIPDEPVVFLKPTSSLCSSGESIVIPPGATRVDHEVEIVVMVGPNHPGLPPSERVAALAIGIDVTDRGLQNQLKEKSLPWLLAKGRDTFAPVSAFTPLASLGSSSSMRWDDIEFTLHVNGELRQKGHTSQMLYPIPRLMEFLNSRFTLLPGDLIFTGTPSGVGPLRAGDRLRAEWGRGPGPGVDSERRLGVLEVGVR